METKPTGNPETHYIQSPRFCVEHGTQPSRQQDGSYMYSFDRSLLPSLPPGHQERIESIARAAAGAVNMEMRDESNGSRVIYRLRPFSRG